MIQRGDGARFALEALGEGFFRELDGDGTVEASVASLVHFAHAARANGRNNLVRSLAGSGRERHSVANDFILGKRQR
jgi:hypothetical protein